MQLSAKDLAIGYGKDKVVFSALNFSAGEGDVIALLGVNGIGKSTLLRTMAGLQAAVSGSLQIGGKNLPELSASERATLVSIVLTERVFIDNISVYDFISLGRAPYTSWLGALSEDDIQQVEQVITSMHLEKYRDKFFNRLSDGERQKVLIARALCQQTPVIILDEPSAFLDFRNKREILSTLQRIGSEMGKTIIFSTHDIETSLHYANKCWILTEEKEFSEIKRTENFERDVKIKLQIAVI